MITITEKNRDGTKVELVPDGEFYRLNIDNYIRVIGNPIQAIDPPGGPMISVNDIIGDAIITKITDDLKFKVITDLTSKEKEIIKGLLSMKSFSSIEVIPSCRKEIYDAYVIPNFIRCGAIPREELIPGKEYLGSCRNASKAVWNGKEFEYTRHKWGSSYKETINHFEDDDGFDLFVPYEEI